MRRKLEAEAQEVEKRIRTDVLKSLQEHIAFLDERIAKLQDRIQALERENELLRKKNRELEARLEKGLSNTGFHEVI
jgi:septal ring factor EnvC (AmiA/AmiB activator)